MPRKTTSKSPKQPEILALSDLHIYLQALEKDHQSLLKNIKKKRTELNNFVEQMRTVATEIFHRASPLFKEMGELDQEIHALFNELFSTRKMGKQTYAKVQGIYRSLQLGGIISPRFQEDEDEDEELDDLFDHEQQPNHFSEEHRQNHQHYQTQPESELSSRAGTNESRKIRQTFLKLAEIFHPDKVTDTETQMSHTEIMKEINKAYQEGDLARLLEIERQYEVGDNIDVNSEDDLTRRCKKLEQQNEILKIQYENLKRELRLAKNTPEGAMLADHRKAAKQGIDSTGLMLKALESQINVVREIRNFVRDFKDKKITVQQFSAGPEILRNMNQQFIEDMLEEMLEQFEVEFNF
ncbi:MAG TPA: J domain-containing protein [Nostocaceae cyanobacterium]|nr:J domain-containing protein [Nostocaceae cyanobacterium]